MSTTEFTEKLVALRKSELSLQKDVVIFISKKDAVNSTFKCKFEDALKLYENEKAAELIKFQNDLHRLNNTIAIFRRDLTKPRPDMIHHVKSMMEAIESQLVSIKDYQKSIYDSLITSETALSAELTLFDNDLHKYEYTQSRTVRYHSVKSRAQTSHQHNLHPAIIEFDRYCATHGPTNKWGEFEHQLFMSHYSKKESDAWMAQKMAEALPFKSNTQIVQQILWYRKYEVLEKSKKDALKEWRETKKTKNPTKGSRLENDETIEVIKSKKKELFDKEREERLGHLNAYKVQKELQRVLAEEDALKNQIRESAKESKRKDYVKKQKEKVQEFKERKRLEEELEKAAAHDEEQRQKSQKNVPQSHLMRLHQKNMKVIENRQQQLQDKIVAEFEKQQQLERLKPKINVKSDPSRLFQKTQGQINREKDRSSNVNPVVGSRNMPHRAMPSWRKGL